MVLNKISASVKQRLEAELETLVTDGRMEIAQKIKEARSFGDLSENSEYDEAKNDQAKLEARISEIESILNNCVVIGDNEFKTDEVGMGCKVKIQDIATGAVIEYSIVSSIEANPREKKISEQSPLGQAMLGKRVGDEFELPTTQHTYKILEIGI